MSVKKMLGSGGFFMFNKEMLKECGFNATFLFAVLIDGESIVDDEWFYQTVEQIEHFTYGHLKKREISSAVKVLEDAGVIETKRVGLPPKRYFRLNENRIKEIIGGDTDI